MVSKSLAAIAIAVMALAGGWVALMAAGFLPTPTLSPPAPVGPSGESWPQFYQEVQYYSADEHQGVYDIVILDGSGRCVAIPHFHVRGSILRDQLLTAQVSAGNNAIWVWEGSLKVGDIHR